MKHLTETLPPTSVRRSRKSAKAPTILPEPRSELVSANEKQATSTGDNNTAEYDIIAGLLRISGLDGHPELMALEIRREATRLSETKGSRFDCALAAFTAGLRAYERLEETHLRWSITEIGRKHASTMRRTK